MDLKNSQLTLEIMQEAEFKKLDDGTFYGEIKSCSGVWANENTLEECRKVLQEVFEEWLNIKEFEETLEEE